MAAGTIDAHYTGDSVLLDVTYASTARSQPMEGKFARFVPGRLSNARARILWSDAGRQTYGNWFAQYRMNAYLIFKFIYSVAFIILLR